MGIPSSGAIIYISQLYDSSISDKESVARSSILDPRFWEERDLCMAHGGFITADDLKALNVKLNISAFLSGRDQLAKAEEEESLSIASVRIHFESTMRWTKTFSLIRNKIPLAFHGSIYQLRKVTCLLCKFLLSLIQKNFRRRMSWKH